MEFDKNDGANQLRLEITLEEAYKGGEKEIVSGNEKLKIKFNPGIRDNEVIKLTKNDQPLEGGQKKENFFVKVKVHPHPFFKRIGNDLKCDLHVSVYTAILGGKTSIPSLKGIVKVSIPPESPSGRIIRLKGLGMPDYENPDKKGDLYAILQLDVPKNLSTREISLLNELQKIYLNKN